MRPRVALAVRASLAISSSPGGIGTRRDRSRAVISASSLVMSSTGRRVRPVIRQASQPISAVSSATCRVIARARLRVVRKLGASRAAYTTSLLGSGVALIPTP